MAAGVTVDMVMILVHGVPGRLTLVVVVLMASMEVTVVHVVDMVPMRDRDMATSFAVHMVVFDVLVVGGASHRFSPPFRPKSGS